MALFTPAAAPAVANEHDALAVQRAVADGNDRMTPVVIGGIVGRLINDGARCRAVERTRKPHQRKEGPPGVRWGENPRALGAPGFPGPPVERGCGGRRLPLAHIGRNGLEVWPAGLGGLAVAPECVEDAEYSRALM